MTEIRKKNKQKESEDSQDNEVSGVIRPNPTDAVEEEVVDLNAPLKQRLKTDILARPRLVVDRMQLENFKSYAGIQNIGPFDKCFTAVVGPNGSGKSNVLDALCFVFGKRAKQLRQGKIGQLVHCSASHPDIQEASVTVFFHEVVDVPEGGRGATRPVPGSELTLKRTANKNDVSKYYVNGHASNFTEVTEILRKKGVDLEHNRFLILQGEVEQIALLPPKAPNKNEEGMLEYLEDIIGTNRYIELIDNAAADLDKVQEQRTEQLNRVKLVAREKQSLEAAKLEAEEFLHYDQTIIERKALIAQKQISDAEKACSVLKERQALITQKLEEEQKKQAESIKHLSDLESEIKKANDAFEAVSKEIEKAKSELDAFQRNDVQLGEDEKHCNTQMKKLEKTLAREQEKLRSLETQITDKKQEQRELTERIASLTQQLEKEQEALNALYDGLKGETGQLQAEMDKKQAELLPSQTKQQELQAQEIVYSGELNLIYGADEAKRQEVERLKKEVEGLVAKEKRLEEELKRVSETLRNQATRLEECRNIAAQSAKKEESLAKDLRILNARVAEKKASAEAARSRGAVFNAIMQLKASKKVSGIYGRLGDLGSIDPKYDVAVTTACHALDNIVVQNAETGQACLEHLRETRAGRGTFIILDEIVKLPWIQRALADSGDNKYVAPEGSQRLFDLITFSHDRFRPAFYWALSDTLVVEQADMATTIAFRSGPRRRVVTLEGQLMEPSGTMSGGGQRVLRGGMNLNSSGKKKKGRGEKTNDDTAMVDDDDDATLEDLEKSLKAVKEEYDNVRNTRAAAEREIVSLESMSATTSAKLEMDIAETKSQRVDAEKRLAEAESKPAITKEQKKRAEELEKLIADGRAEAEKLRNSSAKLEAEITKIKERIMQAGGSRLREQKQTVASLREEVNAAEKAVTKCDVDINSMEKSATKCRNAISKAEKDIEETKAKLEKIKEDVHLLEEKALVVMKAYEEAQSALQSKEAVVKAKQQELTDYKEQQSKAATAEAELKDALEDCKKQIAERTHTEKVYTNMQNGLRDEWHNVLVLLAGGQEEYDRDQQEAQAAKEQEKQNNPNVVEDEDDEEKMNDASGKPQEQQKDPFKPVTPEELDKLNIDDLKLEMNACEEHKSKLSPNMSAIADYRAKDREYQSRMRELEQTTRVRDELRQKCEDLRRRRLVEFTEGFEQITLKLKEMYRMLTIGGDAELELVDRLNPFSEGVVFSVRPAKKTWKNISNLSGGEKTLSSLALVFALQHFKPTPIYVMDEIDAALDFRNVSIVANYIKDCTRGAQFIVISLRNYMFELADRLVGIYKIADCTGSIAIYPSQYASALSNTPPLEDDEDAKSTKPAPTAK